MKNKKEKARFIEGIGAVGVFAGIMWLIILIFKRIDANVSNFFALHQSILGVKAISTISSAGSNSALIAIIIGIISVLYFLGKKKEAVFYSLIIISGLAFELLLKEIIRYPRPINLFETSFSFPSGHTFMAFILAGALAYILWPKYKKIIFCLFGVSAIIMFSRIYLNVHWISDIFGSIALASVWLILWTKIFSIMK